MLQILHLFCCRCYLGKRWCCQRCWQSCSSLQIQINVSAIRARCEQRRIKHIIYQTYWILPDLATQHGILHMLSSSIHLLLWTGLSNPGPPCRNKNKAKASPLSSCKDTLDISSLNITDHATSQEIKFPLTWNWTIAQPVHLTLTPSRIRFINKMLSLAYTLLTIYTITT